MDDFNKLINKLPLVIDGEWIKKNSNYESGLCESVGWNKVLTRYYDATSYTFKIEIKKGKSIWLDLVRYSEIVLGKGDEDTITAFFIPNNDRTEIVNIYFVKTKSIIDFLRIDKTSAEYLLRLNEQMPHSLNCQASMTIADVKRLAFYTYNCNDIF
ncbi:MAG: hypothetical protein IJO18_00125 [Alphaproteobacteria bacterium]|nr:hypothetical protein [Alphaproteobacteria bacterium]